jgi:hypothetical protein
MLRKLACRVIASIVAFLCGCGASGIVNPPVQTVPPAETRMGEITSITFKTHGCADESLKCPAFEATFRSDGTATYIGKANDEYPGLSVGKFAQRDFAALADEMRRQKFFDMPRVMESTYVDETIVLEVVGSEGSHTVTTYNWPQTPVELRKLLAVVHYQILETPYELVKE